MPFMGGFTFMSKFMNRFVQRSTAPALAMIDSAEPTAKALEQAVKYPSRINKKRYWQTMKRLYGGTDEAVQAVRNDPLNAYIWHATPEHNTEKVLEGGLKSNIAGFGEGVFMGEFNKAKDFGDDMFRLKTPTELIGTNIKYPHPTTVSAYAPLKQFQQFRKPPSAHPDIQPPPIVDSDFKSPVPVYVTPKERAEKYLTQKIKQMTPEEKMDYLDNVIMPSFTKQPRHLKFPTVAPEDWYVNIARQQIKAGVDDAVEMLANWRLKGRPINTGLPRNGRYIGERDLAKYEAAERARALEGRRAQAAKIMADQGLFNKLTAYGKYNDLPMWGEGRKELVFEQQDIPTEMLVHEGRKGVGRIRS